MSYEGSNKEMATLLMRSDTPDDPADVKRYVPGFHLMMESVAGGFVRYDAYADLAARLATAESNLRHRAELEASQR